MCRVDERSIAAMNWVNEQIYHTGYGHGIVVSHIDGRISVLFSEAIGEKSFLYPEAFERYLKTANPSFQEQAAADLQLKREQLAAEKIRQEQLRIEGIHKLAEEKLAAKSKARKKAAPRKKKN